ncbi:MAG: hypothetical protein EHM61_03855 [Acidobacteria bacterium]|nr:MAG: hypothetical protein EHM61_03855 [Acidobacteriota bacterium]
MALDPVSTEPPVKPTGGRILVACALKRETDSIKDLLPRHVELLTTGVGSRHTRKILIRRLQRSPAPGVLVFTGTAGQLDPACAMGTVVCPERWLIDDDKTTGQISGDLMERLRARGWVIAGSGLTVSLPVMRASSRLDLFQRTGAAICDMEAAAALQVAAQFGIPALAVKVISDGGDCDFLDFYRNLNKNLHSLGLYLQRLLQELTEILPSMPIQTGEASSPGDGMTSPLTEL